MHRSAVHAWNSADTTSHKDNIEEMSADVGVASVTPLEVVAFAQHNSILPSSGNWRAHNRPRSAVISSENGRGIEILQSFDLRAQTAASECSPAVMEPVCQQNHLQNPPSIFQAGTSQYGKRCTLDAEKHGDDVPAFVSGDQGMRETGRSVGRCMDEATTTTAPRQPSYCAPGSDSEIDHSALGGKDPSAVSRAERLRQLVQQSRQRLLCKPRTSTLENQEEAARIPHLATSVTETLTIMEV